MGVHRGGGGRGGDDAVARDREEEGGCKNDIFGVHGEWEDIEGTWFESGQEFNPQVNWVSGSMRKDDNICLLTYFIFIKNINLNFIKNGFAGKNPTN